MLQLLPVAVLCLQLLPLLLCENLLCYFSPILEKEKKFELIVTECTPNEVCFKVLGRYGNFTALSARGCLLEKSCGKQSNIRLKGTGYVMTYSCCDWPYCNLGVTVKPFYVLATLMAVCIMAC
ncbi:protein Bouncer-like [Girardinichthys multiradiatus]|uniref:protein Bouncer-like n=1 Tax=Girardinichthys multiradiatus TaxID=208333 RepID=UPI001FAD21C3|nr:protein Bouncer-like [Girardinichthys multiradiatus]